MEKNFVFPIIAIIIILTVAFLSQQTYFKKSGENLVSSATSKTQAQLSKGSEWINTNLISKVTGGAKNGGEAIKNTIEKEKNNISENILEKSKNYFSGIANSITKPGTPQNCPPVVAPTK